MYIHLVFLLVVFLHVRCIPQTEFVTTVLSKCVCVIIFTPFLSMDRLPIILAPVFWGLHLAESSSDQSNWNRLKKKFGVVSPYQHLL